LELRTILNGADRDLIVALQYTSASGAAPIDQQVRSRDHPAEGPQWYADVNAPFWNGPAKVTCEYVTRLF